MDTSFAPPPLTVPEESEPGCNQIGQLRAFRAELQGVLRVMDEIGTGSARLAYYADFLQRVRTRGEALLLSVEQCQAADDVNLDSITRIRNTWERLKPVPLFLSGSDALLDEQERAQNIALIRGLCREIIADIGMRTIPARLNEWLELAQPGYYVPFHSVFADELPDSEDRTRVLQFLAWSPKALESGLVDVGNGLIYRFNKHRRAQVLSVVAVIILFAILTAGVWYLPEFGASLVPDDLDNSAALGLWFAVLAGIVIHIAVDMVKRIQSNRESPPVLAAADVLPRINAHLGSILFKLLLAVIGMLALVTASQTVLMTALLAGYSLDSVVDIFGRKLESRSLQVGRRLAGELVDSGGS